MRPLLLLLFAASLPADDAAGLLARVRAAYQRNQAQEKHWNWTAVETRTLINKTGNPIESFPAVTAESLIKSDGRRCNAVVSWGDGRKPYMADADSDTRCQAMDYFRAPFSVAALLEGANATAAGSTLTILPDKARLKSKDNAVRCAASIRATVQVDPATSFPTRIEGEVAETGCDLEFSPVMQYGSRSTGPAKSNFRKGATFRMDFALQQDRLGHPENSFWITVSQRYVQPWDSENFSLYYWGRRVTVTAGGAAHRLVKEVRTTAKEFGAESQLRFDVGDK